MSLRQSFVVGQLRILPPLLFAFPRERRVPVRWLVQHLVLWHRLVAWVNLIASAFLLRVGTLIPLRPVPSGLWV